MPAQHLWSAPLHRGEQARAQAWSGARRRASIRQARRCERRDQGMTATVASPAPSEGCERQSQPAKSRIKKAPPRPSRTRAADRSCSRAFCRQRHSVHRDLLAGLTEVARHRSLGNRFTPRQALGRLSRRKTPYSSSNPASPSSSANASIVPLLFQASAETGAVPFLRTRISAPSFSRTIRMVPSL